MSAQRIFGIVLLVIGITLLVSAPEEQEYVGGGDDELGGGDDELRGDAEISADDDYAFADRVGAKYQANLRDHDEPGDKRVVVTIRPVRVNAIDMRS